MKKIIVRFYIPKKTPGPQERRIYRDRERRRQESIILKKLYQLERENRKLKDEKKIV
jgi:hypothetical protein